MPHVSKRNRAYSTGLCFSHSCWKRRYSMELQLVHEILHQNYLQSPSIGIVQSIIFISICFYFVHLSFFLTNESPVSCTWSSSECVRVFSPAISPSMPMNFQGLFLFQKHMYTFYFRSICIPWKRVHAPSSAIWVKIFMMWRLCAALLAYL